MYKKNTETLDHV